MVTHNCWCEFGQILRLHRTDAPRLVRANNTDLGAQPSVCDVMVHKNMRVSGQSTTANWRDKMSSGGGWYTSVLNLSPYNKIYIYVFRNINAHSQLQKRLHHFTTVHLVESSTYCLAKSYIGQKV